MASRRASVFMAWRARSCSRARIAVVVAMLAGVVSSTSVSEAAGRRTTTKRTRTATTAIRSVATTTTGPVTSTTPGPTTTVPQTVGWLSVGQLRDVTDGAWVTGDGKWIVTPQGGPVSNGVAEPYAFRSVADGSMSYPLIEMFAGAADRLSVESLSTSDDANVLAIVTLAGVPAGAQRRIVVFDRRTKRLVDVGPFGDARLSGDGSMLFYGSGTIQFGRRGTYETFGVRLPDGAPERASMGTNGEQMQQRPFVKSISRNGRRALFENQLSFSQPLSALVRDLDAKTTTDVIGPNHRTRFFPQPVALSGNGEVVAVGIADQPNTSFHSMWLLPVVSGPEKALRSASGQLAQIRTGHLVLADDGRSGLFVSSTMIPVTPPPTSPDALSHFGRPSLVEYFDERGSTVVPLPYNEWGDAYEIRSLSASRDLNVMVVCANVLLPSAASTPATTTTIVPGSRVTSPLVPRCFAYRRF